MSLERGSPADWLRFARSDLAVAKGPSGDDVLLEMLCFHAQQAVEKSVKAVLVAKGVDFPRTHNLKILLNLLPPAVPDLSDAGALAGLTDYAASARYPGNYEEVTEHEYQEAIRLAESVVKWGADVLARLGETDV